MGDVHVLADVESAVVDIVTDGLALIAETATVGVAAAPHGWEPSSPPHVQVVCDGVQGFDWPVSGSATVRLVARASSTTEAKRLASTAMGVLCAHDGRPPVAQVRPLTGPLAASDPDTRAELAMTTCQVAVRTGLVSS